MSGLDDVYFNLMSFRNLYGHWWFSVLNIIVGDFDRHLLHIERRDTGQWIVEVCFIRVTEL